MANNAESTITVASLFLGDLSPFSSLTFVGAKIFLKSSSGSGSFSSKAFLYCSKTIFSDFVEMSSSSVSLKPFSINNSFKIGKGSLNK